MKDSELTNCINCKKSARCFKKLIPSELEFINQNKTQIFYRKGENICKQGAFASYVSFISDGVVKLYLESPHNKNINLKILQTSEFIGLSSIYGDNIYNYSTIALKDSTICLIEKDSIKKLLRDNGKFASEIIKWHCENEKQLFRKIQSMGNKQMHGKLADALLYIDSTSFGEHDLYPMLSRNDIAEFANVSLESTVRLLTKWKNDRIIKIDGREIHILDKNRLHEISLRG